MLVQNATPVLVSIAQAANTIREHILAWTDKNGGTVKVIANLAHLWEELMVSSDAPRILICYLGEDPRGDDESKGNWQRVDRQWQVTVVRGHGFKNNHSEDVANSVAFLDALESLRDWVRLILNIGAEWPPMEYKGMEPLPNLAPNAAGNAFLDATAMRFSTANDLKRLTRTAPNQDPEPQ